MRLIPVSGHGSRVENVDHNDYEADNMDEGLSFFFILLSVFRLISFLFSYLAS